MPVCVEVADTSYPLVELRRGMRDCGDPSRGEPFVISACEIGMYVKDRDAISTNDGYAEWYACLERSGATNNTRTDYADPEREYGMQCLYSGWNDAGGLSSEEKSRRTSIALAVVIPILLIALIAAVAIGEKWWAKRRKRQPTMTGEPTSVTDGDILPPYSEGRCETEALPPYSEGR